MQTEWIERNPILKHSIEFSLLVIKYCELLDADRKYIISKQLLRCATSVGANSMEAQNAESKPDFIHKMKIAAKEADEVEYWLMLCDKADGYPECKQLLTDCGSIIRVLSKIIASSKK